MARGDLVLFDAFATDFANGVHNLKDTHALKLGLIDGTITPTVADATPAWGDYSANEVSSDGGYVAGGIPLTFSEVTRWVEAGGIGTLDADDIELTQNLDGFTDARWAILYNDTAAGDQAIGFVDLGGDVNEATGPVAINWNAAGILIVTVNPA